MELPQTTPQLIVGPRQRAFTLEVGAYQLALNEVDAFGNLLSCYSVIVVVVQSGLDVGQVTTDALSRASLRLATL